MRAQNKGAVRPRLAVVAAALFLLAAATTSAAVLVASASNVAASAASTARTKDYGNGRLMAADPAGGYWLADWAGHVTPYGGAPALGSVGGTLNQPIVSMAATPSGGGYWLVARDGGIFSYGDAHFYGSTGSLRLNQPIVGIAPTPDGAGYWLVAADGGIFSYGDARFYGSTGSIHLNQPIVGMASTPDGAGYWLVAADGGIFPYGDAQFYGSTGSIHLGEPIIAMAPTPDGNGYWLVASDGGLFSYGDAPFYGSLGGGTAKVDGIVVTPATAGYELVTATGAAQSFALAAPPTKGDPTVTTASPTTPQPGALVVPGSIADNCSRDVTSALNSWLAHTPAGAVVDLPTNACYLVSNTSTTLALNRVNGLTINGDGATLRQSVYENGRCGGNEVQPVLTLTSDSNVTVNDLTIAAPGNCGGAYNEGDYGILLGQSTPGNTNITFDGVTVENTDGDGLAVMPQLGTCCGINTNITFESGAFTNIGYHTITPEGVNGLTIASNLFTNDGNFMDMEVDNDGGGNGAGTPTGNAQWNITIEDNTFTDGSALSISSIQGNIVTKGNVLDASTQGIVIVLGGSESSTCGQDSGLTIQNNLSFGGAHSPCGGSVATPPACSMIEVADYKNVTISGNYFTANDGEPEYDYYDNTIYVPCLTFSGVTTAWVYDNTCNNAWDIWDSTNWQFPSDDYPDSAISDCGNTYWLTSPVNGAAADPRSDRSCS
jgi:hypothetical protein